MNTSSTFRFSKSFLLIPLLTLSACGKMSVQQQREVSSVVSPNSVEEKVTGWYQTGSANVSVMEGTDDVVVRIAGPSGLARNEITGQVRAGKSYRASAEGKTDNSSETAVMGVQFFDMNWNMLGDQKIKISSADFAPLNIDFVVPLKAEHVRLYVSKAGRLGSTLEARAVRFAELATPVNPVEPANPVPVPVPTPTPVPAPTPVASTTLRYAPPALVNPTTIEVGNGLSLLNLDTAKDYVIKLPPYKKTGGLALVGGHNIVVVGGHITIPKSANGLGGVNQRAIYVAKSTGTVHIEGILVDASGGGESDAIAINAPLATVQIQNFRVDGIMGKNSTWHADLVQPFGGVKELRIHNFTGSSYYQGFQIPIDRGPIGKAILSNVNVQTLGAQTSDSGGQLIWVAHNCQAYPISMDQVYVKPRDAKPFGASVFPQSDNANCPFRITKDSSGREVGGWSNLNVTGRIQKGIPSTGDFVPTGRAGVLYVR